MVPVRLTPRNFLCYRDCPTVDLEHVRVACLTGENGNGKSALLDAITWALWGRARGRDAEMISLGQTEMEVEFEFDVGAARYRVIRKAQRTGSKGATHATLHFHVQNGEAWKDQSGSTLAETQRAVQDVLKLSYDTFVNSAFLVQGKADAFTVKTAGERKQVLAEILNLAQYDIYEERAKTRRNDRAVIVSRAEQQVHDAEAALARLPALRDDRTAFQTELAELTSERDHQTIVRDSLRQAAALAATLAGEMTKAERDRDEAVRERGRLEERAAERRATIERYAAVVAEAVMIRDGYSRLQASHAALHKVQAEIDAGGRELHGAKRASDQAQIQLRGAEERVAIRKTAIARDQAMLAGRDAVLEGYRQLRQAREDETLHGGFLATLMGLQRQLQPLDTAIRAAEATLRADHQMHEANVTRLARVAAVAADLQERRMAVAREQVELDVIEGCLATARADEAGHRAALLALESENRRLLEEMTDLRRKVDELKVARDHGDADCPLCRTPVGHEGLGEIERSYQVDGKAKAGRHRTNKGEMLDHEAAAQASAQEAARLDVELTRRRGVWHRQSSQIERDLAEAEAAAKELIEARAAVAALATALATGDFARDERERAEAVRAEIAATAYHQETHTRAREASAGLGPFEAKYRELEQAESRLAVARDSIASEEPALTSARDQAADTATRLAEIRATLTTLDQQHERLRQDAAALAVFETRHHALIEAESRLVAAREQAPADEEAVAGAIRRGQDAEARVAELRTQLAAHAGIEDRLRPVEDTVRRLVARCDELRGEIGGIERQIEDLEEMERDTAARRSQLDEAKREHAVYDQLVTAFGKRGAQALIIDSALPEIESVANELLARMTNNRMHVALDTQRQTQKGTVTETLDIKIADEWGTRNYEMFSGGEAFRINLALRIALSKLLARRAGAPLPTLVIDEGFGTQDTAGRERLIEAITAIQDEFRCLLVVTHIDELKDLFETRIEVIKHGDGSIARVVTA